MNRILIPACTALAVIVIALLIGQTFLKSPDVLLEEHKEIEDRLTRLASIVPVSGTGPSGCLFELEESAESAWIELSWPEPRDVNEVVIVPMLAVNSSRGNPVAQGWPGNVEILVADDELVSVASQSFGKTDAVRAAPHIFRFPEQRASRIRIKFSALATRAADTTRICPLAEILVFSGDVNIAESATILLSDGLEGENSQEKHVIDGRLPYELVGSGGGTSPYAKPLNDDEEVVVSIELAAPILAKRFALFPNERSITVPWRYPPGNGFPSFIQIDAATTPDFADVTVLVDRQLSRIISSSPVFLNAPEATAPYRYFRFRLGASPNYRIPERLLCSLAELQILDGAGNAARQIVVREVSPLHNSRNRIESLFDGKNRFGGIPPVRTWMHQLAECQILELRLVEIEVLLAQAHEWNSRFFHWTPVALICFIAASFLLYLYKIMRLKALALESQELLLAELHDEIGASLHAIRMFAEMAESSPDIDQKRIVSKIHVLASETAQSVRRVTHLLDEGLTGEAFVKELEQHAKWLPARIGFKLDLDITDEGLAQIPPADLGHLLRFYHECLANLTRHAGQVSQVEVLFTTKTGVAVLEVRDDGQGLKNPTEVPKSLIRRAKLARGRVSATQGIDGQGTSIRIGIKQKSAWAF